MAGLNEDDDCGRERYERELKQVKVVTSKTSHGRHHQIGQRHDGGGYEMDMKTLP